MSSVLRESFYYTIHPHPNPLTHRGREIRLSASESLPPPRGKVRMGVVGCPSRLDPIFLPPLRGKIRTVVKSIALQKFPKKSLSDKFQEIFQYRYIMQLLVNLLTPNPSPNLERGAGFCPKLSPRFPPSRFGKGVRYFQNTFILQPDKSMLIGLSDTLNND